MIIDSHCHLDYPNLYDQLFNVLNRAKRNKVHNLLTICTTLESFEKIKIIVNKYNNIYGTFGIHPHETKNFTDVNSDFIIARGGFNTISECLTNQIPAIFFDEKNNPEIKDNLNSLKKLGLSTSMKFNDWGKYIQKRLKKYFLQEEKFIIYNLKKYKFNTNGANQVCKDILRRIK